MGKTDNRNNIAIRRLASLASLLTGIVLASLVVCTVHSKHVSHVVPAHASNVATPVTSADSNALAAADSDSSPSPRDLYPYSVIPGGVESASELQTAVRNDPVVARHYADFDLAKTRTISLDRDRLVYVSYRIGGEIFWTNRALRLHKGETLITDGAHEARTRCGNRISETAQAPLSAQQPALDAFEGFAPAGPFYASNMPIEGELTPPSPYTPAHPFVMERNDYAPAFFPFVPGPGFGSGSIYSNNSGPSFGPGSSSGAGSTLTGGGTTGSGSPSGQGSPSGPGSSSGPGSPGSPPIATPEPSTLLLLSMGLGGWLVGSRFCKRIRSRS